MKKLSLAYVCINLFNITPKFGMCTMFVIFTDELFWDNLLLLLFIVHPINPYPAKGLQMQNSLCLHFNNNTHAGVSTIKPHTQMKYIGWVKLQQ
jgi:hypothetical protein